MTTLTIADFCIDCGEHMNTPDAPCTPAHCQYEGVNGLLTVMFSFGPARVSYEIEVCPSTPLQAVVEIALEDLEETGIDTDLLELTHIWHRGNSIRGNVEMFETPEELCLCCFEEMA